MEDRRLLKSRESVKEVWPCMVLLYFHLRYYRSPSRMMCYILLYIFTVHFLSIF